MRKLRHLFLCHSVSGGGRSTFCLSEMSATAPVPVTSFHHGGEGTLVYAVPGRLRSDLITFHLFANTLRQLLDFFCLLDDVKGKNGRTGVIHVLFEFRRHFQELVGVALQG